ncbi:glycosyltransferase [Dactylosporangium fulvum]|uniref:Glycosyltransferase n=1 Tax=Dactylosporangium fulvum TaxID=53359 RepID=A0ABY5VYJ7_9ACTN|nr:glycosyltransferase [Dactylosporangium fulvum]UWP82787.1 glycosyltransferase [Dactylosporangium fulvum]
MSHPAATYRLGIVSTYLPRQCGLATYTADLREALGVATDDLETVVVAIDRDGHTYGDEVVVTINQDRIEDYSAAARVLREAGVQVVLIQHEYGIFGGPDGSHLLELTRALNACGIPYLLTLHTVLPRPSPGQAATLRALCARAARVTVFTETARRVAIRTGIAAGHQLVVVPHGAPEAMRHGPDPETLRPELRDLLDAVSGKPTLTTFGLLGKGKGIDIAIDALAEVVKKHPETQYIVAGTTHPEIKRQEGEVYRESLQAQVQQLGLSDNVHFVDAFLALDELSAILHASTLFVTPYRQPEQICSGALTFALGAGLPAVSTSYSYAEDMLAGGAGRVVPIGDGTALATEIIDLLSDARALAAAKSVAEACAAWLPWPAVAAREADLFADVVRQTQAAAARPGHATAAAPALNLAHLEKLTDEIGIIQFSRGPNPDMSSGYCVDDVARLAIVAADLLAVGTDAKQTALATRWLRQSMRFLIAAYDPSGAMHNVLSYGGTWQDWPHLGDHVGRTVWTLGVLVGTPAVPDDIRRPASALLDELGPRTAALPELGLRSAAYALIGLARAGRTDQAAPLLRRLDEALVETSSADPGWRWFEPELTYDNARLAQAMLLGAALLEDDAAAGRAIAALDWYVQHVGLADGTLRCVGNHWHRRGESPALWLADDGDEQPLDAAAITEALVDAWQHTAEPVLARLAGWGFAWFLGRNRAGARLYVDATGACHDGLSATEPNGNQGAESTLAYYQALLSLLRAGLAALPHPVVATAPVPTSLPVTSMATKSGNQGRAVGRASAGFSATATPPRSRTTEGQPDAL